MALTVKELIDLLEIFDPESPVFTADGAGVCGLSWVTFEREHYDSYGLSLIYEEALTIMSGERRCDD